MRLNRLGFLPIYQRLAPPEWGGTLSATFHPTYDSHAREPYLQGHVRQPGKIYEVYARKVSHGNLFGFIEIEELVFGERSTVVLDPTEERIKAEFEGVKRSYLPMHAVLRIDEVKKQGVSKISTYEGSNVAQFPMPMMTPPAGDGSKK